MFSGLNQDAPTRPAKARNGSLSVSISGLSCEEGLVVGGIAECVCCPSFSFQFLLPFFFPLNPEGTLHLVCVIDRNTLS